MISSPGANSERNGATFENHATRSDLSVAPTLTFAGSDTPAAGAYVVRSQLPTAVVGFLSYADSSNGGYGSVLFEVSFDSGAHWLTLYATGVTDRLGGIVAVAHPGRDYEFRVTLTNDGDGNGAEVYKLLFCTGPSVWG